MADAFKKVFNILLLGETGVGKSTFINAFLNYLTFDSMQNAIKNDITYLIPSSFVISDDKLERKKVECGNDRNELTVSGQSATQSCKSYKFLFENHIIRLIDTPGIGDTRGIVRDYINCENIMAFIKQYEDLHAICILLKPNNPRSNISFKFCIKQILCHLEKSASNNILFVFTNSRQTFYKPGDTTVPLKKLLSTVKKNPPFVDIAYNKDTVFCIDSEAFRFLVAYKNGVHFSEDDRSDFTQSWVKSSNECLRLIKKITGDGQIKGLVPHKVRNTILVNDARKQILLLQKPIGDVSKYIQKNLKTLERLNRKINENISDIEKLKTKLYVSIKDIISTPFKNPRTVCTGSNCRDIIAVDNTHKYHYKTVCHDPCYELTNVSKGIIGDEALRNCAAMGNYYTREKECYICTCSYKLHMNIDYDTKVVTVNRQDLSVSNRIKIKKGSIENCRLITNDLEKRIMILNLEQKIISTFTVKFAYFLRNNAIIPYNDTFKEYLNYLIENEKIMPLNSRPDHISGLQKMIYDYEEQQKILDEANRQSVKYNVSPVTAEDILKMSDELYKLKIMGVKVKEPLIRMIFDVTIIFWVISFFMLIKEILNMFI